MNDLVIIYKNGHNLTNTNYSGDTEWLFKKFDKKKRVWLSWDNLEHFIDFNEVVSITIKHSPNQALKTEEIDGAEQ